MKPIYQRILLKLSGEGLQGANNFGIDEQKLNIIAKEIKELSNLKVQVAVVIGGGNIFRGASLANIGMNRVVADHIGMLATVINGLAIRDSLQRIQVNARLMSAIPLNGICDNYSWTKAISLLRANKVVIFAAGTGNPFFTTDSAACLRAIEINANIVIKATKVDGVYSADPIIYPKAVLYNTLNYKDILQKELKIMDLAAFTLARDHQLPIHVFNMNKSGALIRIVMGKTEGTLISH
ncbi:UMP kinase [Candidatus Ishikawella capsulata]|uniref:Uridylate kinase n=1 Tax=Candidatus Ishikawaella capsulata Mpkobe TaxID=476281 RepID=C5WCK7_9ENTR|nr:UMP kinase [Candidatus Ishikawaella capsulata]BAH83063.1 uridylate kinase [Candidatus Ishikawaella capsulata Mpkobe]